METFTFNTGRPYTAQGQIIRAAQLENGRIIFADMSRGIDGILPEGTELSQSSIMRAYDAGCYQWAREANQLRDAK